MNGVFNGFTNNVIFNNDSLTIMLHDKFDCNANFDIQAYGPLSQGLFRVISMKSGGQPIEQYASNDDILLLNSYNAGGNTYYGGQLVPSNSDTGEYCYHHDRVDVRHMTTGDAINLGTQFLKFIQVSYKLFQFAPVLQIKGYTNCMFRDPWQWVPSQYDGRNSLPVVGEDCGMGAHQLILTLNELNTSISSVGESGWGKTSYTWCGGGRGASGAMVTDIPINGGGGYDTTEMSQSEKARYLSQLTNKLQSGTTTTAWLEAIEKTDGTLVGSICPNNNNFERHVYDMFAQDSRYNGKKAYKTPTNSNITFAPGGLTNHRLNNNEYCVPVLFTLITSSSNPVSYGYNSLFRANAVSKNIIFNTATALAKNFATQNIKYKNFCIYSINDTYIISNAIDVRPMANGGSAVEGKTTFTDGDILAIAHRNIYIMSVTQLTNYICPLQRD